MFLKQNSDGKIVLVLQFTCTTITLRRANIQKNTLYAIINAENSTFISDKQNVALARKGGHPAVAPRRPGRRKQARRVGNSNNRVVLQEPRLQRRVDIDRLRGASKWRARSRSAKVGSTGSHSPNGISRGDGALREAFRATRCGSLALLLSSGVLLLSWHVSQGGGGNTTCAALLVTESSPGSFPY